MDAVEGLRVGRAHGHLVEVDRTVHARRDLPPGSTAVGRRDDAEIAAARRVGDLRLIRDELIDRFGRLPEEVENLLSLQQARIGLGSAGASAVQFRGGRLTVVGIELDSEAADLVRRKVDGVLYDWKVNEISLRVDNDPQLRLEAITRLADALGEVRMDMLPNSL
ncbi:MAG: hypothetical protein F9K43_14560 [Bauldia sp.]|nr:MAG: hypothetical protein F9K43_14560 [Bauldia sp.]